MKIRLFISKLTNFGIEFKKHKSSITWFGKRYYY
jgi:hypothetical protein